MEWLQKNFEDELKLSKINKDKDRKAQKYKGRKTERQKGRKKERQKGGGHGRTRGMWVDHHNFWSIVLDDLGSKKIYRPNVWSYIHLWRSCLCKWSVRINCMFRSVELKSWMIGSKAYPNNLNVMVGGNWWKISCCQSKYISNIYVYCQNAIACSWTMIENLGRESVIGKMIQFFRWEIPGSGYDE